MAGKIQSLKFKNCMYKIKNIKGKSMVGTGKVDFLESKFKEPKNVKMYKFDKFTNGIQEEENKKTSTRKRTKSTITGCSDDTDAEIDPIQIDISDSNIVFDNENSAIFDLRKGNSN